MYIATISESKIIELQNQMKKNKIHYIIISAGILESVCELAYKILIFEELQKENT